MKFYLTTGTVILVLITSMGIFGYLSKAYQGATFELEVVSSKMDFYEAEIYRLEQDKEFIKDEMEQSISLLPDNYIRIEFIHEGNSKRNIILKKL